MSLSMQHATVLVAGVEKTLEVDIINPDLIRYEIEGPRYGLPLDATQAPMQWQTFLAWSALKRTGQYDGEWQKFKLEDCLGVELETITDPATGEQVFPDVPPTGSGESAYS